MPPRSIVETTLSNVTPRSSGSCRFFSGFQSNAAATRQGSLNVCGLATSRWRSNRPTPNARDASRWGVTAPRNDARSLELPASNTREAVPGRRQEVPFRRLHGPRDLCAIGYRRRSARGVAGDGMDRVHQHGDAPDCSGGDCSAPRQSGAVETVDPVRADRGGWSCDGVCGRIGVVTGTRPSTLGAGRMRVRCPLLGVGEREINALAYQNSQHTKDGVGP